MGRVERGVGLDVAAPLLDREAVVRAAMAMSPWARFSNGWHRRVITARCPALAALPTTEGYTASSAPRDLAANLLGFAATQALRVAKKAGQRVAGRAMFLAMGAVTVDVEGFLDLLRGTRAFADALARLKAMDILDPGLTPAGVRDIHVGRVLGMGLLARHLDEGGAGWRSPSPDPRGVRLPVSRR
jgi:hypothetical protein